MRTKLASALTVLALVAMSGCAVQRGQETTGAYVDDTAITTAVKARYVGNKEVDASAISVETLNGTVMLSGFAKNQNERNTAEEIAMKTNGVKHVKNSIVVRP
jgi:osmotically-inducible protein OsmY